MSRTAAVPPWHGSLPLLARYAVLLALLAALTTMGWGSAGAAPREVPATTLGTAPATAPGTVPATTTETHDASVLVRLEAVTPAIATPGTGVVLTGTLGNAGPDPVLVHSVRVSTAYRGLDSRAAVDAWATDGELETPIVIAEDVIGTYLAPGSVVRFFATVPAESLEPGFDFATLPLRLEVTQYSAVGPWGPLPETDAGEGEEDPPAPEVEPLPGSELRSFLPWQATTDESFNPIDIAWLAPVTLPGGSGLVDPDDATRADAWAHAVGPDSRTVALLEGLAGTEATFVIDPALLNPLDPVASLTEAVVQPGEEPTPTDPEPTDPEPTDPEPTDPEPTDPAATDPAATQDQATSQPGGDDQDADDTAATPTGVTPTAATATATVSNGGSNGASTEEAGGTQTSGPPDDTGVTTDPATGPPTDPSTGTPDPDAPQEPVVPPTPPTTEQAVRSVGDRIATLPEERLWWLPVGDPDTAAMLDLDLDVDTVAALVGRPPAEPLPAPGRTDVAWPLAATVDDDLLDGIAQVWTESGGAMGQEGVGNGSLAAGVLPVSALTDAPHTGSATVTHTSGAVLLGYDERLSGVVASGGQPDRDGRTVQRFLAETLAIYQEQPARDRSLAVAIPRTATVDAATLQRLTSTAHTAPWLQETTAAALLDAAEPEPVGVIDPTTADSATTSSDPSVEETAADPSDATREGATMSAGDLAAYSRPGESPLTAEGIAQIEAAREDLNGACEIVPGSDEARETWLRVLDGQYSSRWRQGPDGWEAPTDQALALSREILTGLTINPTTINFFADEGVILITVTNDLPLQIDDLRMTVSPGNARLRVLAQPEPITIGPESRATVQFRARAVAAGQVPLQTSLSTPGGTLVGDPAETEVRVQPTGVWIYWLLGGVAGVILVLGLVRALRPRPKASPPEKSVPTVGPDLENQ